MSEIAEYFKSIPPFTRYFMSGVFLMSFGMTYKLANPMWFILEPNVIWKLQLWRLFTTFMFAGPFSQGFLFSIMMIYFSCSKIEEHFKNKSAEFMTLVVLTGLICIFYSFIYGDYMVMHSPFMFSLMYIWCKLEPDN